MTHSPEDPPDSDDWLREWDQYEAEAARWMTEAPQKPGQITKRRVFATKCKKIS